MSMVHSLLLATYVGQSDPSRSYYTVPITHQSSHTIKKILMQVVSQLSLHSTYVFQNTIFFQYHFSEIIFPYCQFMFVCTCVDKFFRCCICAHFYSSMTYSFCATCVLCTSKYEQCYFFVFFFVYRIQFICHLLSFLSCCIYGI